MRKAFTLIEILVVLAIVVLLAALLLPSLKKARDRGQEVSCMSRAHSIGQAQRMYSDDYDFWLPIGAYNSTIAWVGGKYPDPAWDRTWHDLLTPYLNEQTGVFYCPDASKENGIRWSYGASPWMLPYYAGMPEFRVGSGPKVWMAEHETYDWSSLPRDVYDDPVHSYLKDRHNGRAVTLFLDGRASSIQPNGLSGQMKMWTP